VGSSRVSLHAKLIVVDGRTTFIGSMNIDPRSLHLNTENGLVVESTALAGQITSGIEQQLAASAYRVDITDGQLRWTSSGPDGRVQHQGGEPDAGWWLRLQATLMSWLPIEELL
jgi:putative cardiolipin synthase